MFIKQIIIQGFKSYKDQTVIEPFSPKHNVIVGRNGSGKSNFFAAIRFVLSDQYTQMGREERQGLLHEGAGSAVMSAYVELIFDNSDDRFPTNTPEVILRRTIGQKKDEYSLNRKNTTKQEVMNILESAGFSRSNPYYIVPQGRVTAITNQKDQDRLTLLKRVAGTEVYESRRSESRKIMEETEHKRAKIDDLLDHIRGRLGELEEEKEELRAFQDHERERKCLEYTLFHNEEVAFQKALETLDGERVDGVEQTDDNREALKESEKNIEVIDAQILHFQQQLKLLTEEKAQFREERTDIAKLKAQAELEVQDLTEHQSAAQQAETRRASELKNVESEITRREQELAQLLPRYTAQREQERALKLQLEEVEAAQKRLYAKQGRQAAFRTKRERDEWLRREISESHSGLATRKAVAMQIAEDISELEQQIGHLETEIVSMRSRIENRGDEQQNISAEVQKAKDERDRQSDQRKQLWREDAKLDSVLQSARQQLEKAERFLSQMMDQNTHRGLASVRRIVQQKNIEGAYGPLGELFEFSDRYRTAIEVTAGMSLFHYVVETDDIAQMLIEELQRTKGGRVTFMPLNQLRPKPANIPNANDAVHLVSRLKYEERFEKAMQQVFGKTIVCPNLQVASQYARSHGVSAITPEGDRSDRKGALTGGYYDARKSRLDGIKQYMVARGECESAEGRKAEIRTDLDRIGQSVTKAKSDLEKVEQKRAQMEGGYGPLREELRRHEHDLGIRRDNLDRQRNQRESVDVSVNALSRQLSDYEAELASDFKKALTNAEEQQLETLKAQTPDLKKQHARISDAFSELETQKNVVESLLRDNLRPQRDQLQSSDLDPGVMRHGSSSGSTKLKERKADLKRVTKALETVDNKLREVAASTEETVRQLGEAESTRATQKIDADKLENAIRNHQRAIQKGAQKRAAVLARLEEAKASIAHLGPLPESAFTPKYQRMNPTTVNNQLQKARESLKKYGKVNKKAFEQYAQFERQREALESRRKELDSSDSSIRELIEVLDQRKDEAIERTFKQVSREFAKIFERLVPAGKGRLIIQRRSDQAKNGNGAIHDDDADSDADNAEHVGGSGVENYIGVGISVSFNSKHDEQQRIQQLSGGQKSLCALALIFAIQASDPAPFYLFDEIDANLDAQYRTAVAQMLQESSQTGQFICTTFRPEMLLVAEKCYGVSYLNKASTIDVVSREQALDFVEGQLSGK